MYRFALQNKPFLVLMLVLAIVGIVSSVASYALVPVVLLVMPRFRHSMPNLFAGFFFTLILSDNMLPYFRFAATLKMIYLLVITGMFLFLFKRQLSFRFIVPFLLFFSIAMLCIPDSPVPDDAIMKTVSYGLLMVVVPTFVLRLLHTHKYHTLRLWILLGIIVYVAGLILYMFYPALASPRGRFSGLLGNPNGMGIFSVMFSIFVFIVFYYYPSLCTKKEKIFLYTIIVISLILSGSRGGIFAMAIFFTFQYLYRKSRVLGFIVIIVMGISYQVIESNFVEIVESVGLQNYFRLETLENGSGRETAFTFAWQKLQESPYWGKGLGYTEELMKKYARELSEEGHQGNVHNSYLTTWLDTGIFGLIAFVFAWGFWFFKAGRRSHFALPLLFAVLLSTNVESWLVASLNPFTIQLVFILTLLTSKEFIYNSERLRKSRSVENKNFPVGEPVPFLTKVTWQQ